MVRNLINVLDYGARLDGSDDTAAFQAAIADIPSNGGIVCVPMSPVNAVPKITDTLTLTKTNSHLQSWGAFIDFNPATPKPLFKIGAGGSIISYCSIRGFRGRGVGTVQKIGVQTNNASDCSIRDVSFTSWTGDTSIGFQFKGREVIVLQKVRAFADRPISIESNSYDPLCDGDHYHFTDMYLAAQDVTEPCILLAPDISTTNLTIDGYNAFIGGSGAIYWHDELSAREESNINFHLQNIRYEQTGDADCHAIHLNHYLRNVLLQNVYADRDANGFYFRQVQELTLQNCAYNGTKEALNIDGSCLDIVLNNFPIWPESSVSMTGLTRTFNQPPIEIWQPS